MSRNETYVDAPIDAVWGVLADPESYGEWVVGSRSIRGWDPEWPAVGSRFHHTVGLPLVEVKDHTEVLECERPHRLVLRARARPLGTAKVTVVLRAEGDGTHVVLEEEPADPLTRIATLPFWWLLVPIRNAESIQRLARLSIARAGRVEP